MWERFAVSLQLCGCERGCGYKMVFDGAFFTKCIKITPTE